MQIIDQANSYATRDNATRKLRSVFGDELNDYRWFIVAQEDGRFTPVVQLIGEQTILLSGLVRQGVVVI